MTNHKPFFSLLTFLPTASTQMSSSQPSAAAPSVALPRRERVNVDNGNNPPIWAVSDAVGTEEPPLPVKCDRYGREGVCCKELKGDDERQLLDPDIVRDA